MSATDAQAFKMRNDLAEWLKAEIEPDGRIHVDTTDEDDRFYLDLAEELMTVWTVLRA